MGLPDFAAEGRAFSMWLSRQQRYKADIESGMREELVTYRLWHKPLDEVDAAQIVQANTKG